MEAGEYIFKIIYNKYRFENICYYNSIKVIIVILNWNFVYINYANKIC